MSSLIGSGRNLCLNGFILCAQAPGTKVKVLLLAVYDNGSWMNIGRPAPVCMSLGVTDIRTECRSFSA